MKKVLKNLFYLSDDKEIYPLYTLRFVFFIFIFVHHCYGYVQIPILKQANFAVSGFIILSGFLNGYIYVKKDFKIKEVFKFTINRIKKFYPLHIIMLLASLVITGVFNYTTPDQFFSFIKKLISNIFLIQSWVNNQQYYFGFNGVTWFLSTYIFLTFLTIPIMMILKQINKNKHGNILLGILSIMLFAVTIVISYFIRKNHFDNAFCEFWVYVFPPSRLLEYIIGIIYGIILSDKKINFKYDKVVFSILEIAMVVLIYFYLKLYSEIPNFYYIFNVRFSAWIIPSILLIIVLTFQKGIISKIFSLKPLVYLGKISMHMFIIHQVIIRYIGKYGGHVIHYRYLGLYMLVITIIFGYIIDKYEKNLKK